MSNYKLIFNHTEYGYFELDLEAVISAIGDEKFMTFSQEGASLEKEWEPAAWEFIENSESILPDITSWGFGCLVLSNKAKEILQDDISYDGEFLELKNKEYWIFNCRSRAIADEESSIEIIDRGVHSGLKSLQFIESSTANKNIFKTDFDYFSGFYCSEMVKTKISENALTGVSVTSNLNASEV